MDWDTTKTDAENIAALRQENESLQAQIADDGRVFGETLNEVWNVVFPDDPNGWEYPGQFVRMVNEEIEKLRVLRPVNIATGAGPSSIIICLECGETSETDTIQHKPTCKHYS